MIKKLIAFIVLACLNIAPAVAQSGPGLFIRNGTSSITSPVQWQSYILNYQGAFPQFQVYNGSTYVPFGGPLSNYLATTAPTVSNDSSQGYVVGSIWLNTITGFLYLCTDPSAGAAVWTSPSSVSAGTVTSFSSGNLSPLFTTSVGTATTTPALSFSLTNAASGTIFGNFTGSSGAPSFTASGTNDQLLGVVHSSTGLEYKTLSGSGAITVTPGAGTITLSDPAATSVGNLSPLFTSSLSANAISYSLSTAAAGTLFGNFTGSTGSPSYHAPGTTDQMLGVAHTGGGLEYKTLTAGTGISITPTAGITTFATSAATSIGNLSPLFTSSLSSNAISFSLTNAAAGTIFGNFTGSTGAPSFNAPGSADQVVGVAHTGGGIEYKTINAGSNITVTDGAGSITISGSGASTPTGFSAQPGKHVRFCQVPNPAGTGSDFNYVGLNSTSLLKASDSALSLTSVYQSGYLVFDLDDFSSGSGGTGFFFRSDGAASTELIAHPVQTSRVLLGRITSVRYWIAFTDATTGGNLYGSATPSSNIIGFRYDTSAGDTHWKAVTSNGVTQTTTDTGITPVVNTLYDLVVDCTNPASIVYYINNSVVATITTNIPTTTTQLAVEEDVTSLTGADADLYVSTWRLEDN